MEKEILPNFKFLRCLNDYSLLQESPKSSDTVISGNYYLKIGRFSVTDIIPVEMITSKIYAVQNVKVMLDRDLAELYEVETSQLKRAVRRNIDRFPPDFMFELTKEEFEDLRCQTGISKKGRGGARYMPMAFTEQGVAMLSSVLNSKRAIQVNIQIMRIFTKIRQIILGNVELKHELDELKQQTEERFQVVFEALDQLLAPEKDSGRKIGF